MKIPKAISHEMRLVAAEAAIRDFVQELAPLQPKLGCLLLQLPPSLHFVDGPFEAFFDALRDAFAGPVTVEARHASWASAAASSLLSRYLCDSVDAHPALYPSPNRTPIRVHYVRLHGAPRVYSSPYSDAFIDDLAVRITSETRPTEVWCVFDNTARGAAILNARTLQDRLRS